MPAAEAADVVFAVAAYGRAVPTFVAVKEVTSFGCKKSFAAWDFFPDFFPAAIFISYLFY